MRSKLDTVTLPVFTNAAAAWIHPIACPTQPRLMKCDSLCLTVIQDSLKSEHEVKVFYSDADLRQPSQIKHLVDSVADKLGGVWHA